MDSEVHGICWYRRFAVASTLFLLLLLGCGEDPPPLRMTYLSGPRFDLRSFEGRWFDHGGNLIAVAHSGTDARFGVRLDGFGLLYGVEEISVQNGELLFYLWTSDGWKLPVALKLVGEHEAVMSEVPPEQPPIHLGCCVCSYVYQVSLVRNPSPLWFIKLSARKAAESVYTYFR